MFDKLMTAEELAQYLNLSKAAVYAMVCRRQISFLKIGRRVRFRESEIEAWLEKQTIRPNGHQELDNLATRSNSKNG